MKQHQLLSRSIVGEFYAWLQTIFKPVSKLKKAIVSSINQKEYLCAFLDHEEIEIYNNQVENAIRPIVVTGRTGCSAALTPEPAPVSSSSLCWRLPKPTGLIQRAT